MFRYPQIFIGFFVLIPVIFFLWFEFLRGRKDLEYLLGRWRAGAYLDIFTVKWFFSALALVLFITFMLVAAADPERKGPPEIQTIESRDIVFALDVSLSMLARDSLPSRLDRSVEVMRGILASRGGTSRFSLVVFQEIGVKMIPVTEDLTLFETVFQNIGPQVLSRRGSDLTAGLITAFGAFPRKVESEKLLFVFSDGENFGGSVSAALQDARQMGIRIISIGAGTTEGDTIPLEGDRVVQDSKGNRVITRLNSDTMRYLAQETGGEYFSLNDPALISKLDAVFGSSSVRYNEPRESGYRPYLLIAMFALYVYFLVRVVSWKNTF
ncbi:VWA domain-containing protein [Marispirochaeta sp.]|jgi:Ca-activated chloride channel homolog|uniref:vWA domain-containing protein n=1 Tax=Marispirochaeta sp. TaxID=2038653 RepID=UPI0029C6556F|nr:VWA domain-containing protein [Marispirochaeta sp.]